MCKVIHRFMLAGVMGIVCSCAHHETAKEPVESAPKAAVVPAPVNTRIKYIYVESPSTTSAMTTAPFERTEPTAKSFTAEVVQVFWPLLTMMATGLVFILILLVEHRVLNRQLAQRAELKKQLQSA